MVTVQTILRQVPDPRGGQGLQHPLFALLGLIVLSLLSGCKDMKAAFNLGRALSLDQLRTLGFRPGYAAPCHATLTQLLRILDPAELAVVLNQVIAKPGDETEVDDIQIVIDGKTLQGCEDDDVKVVQVLLAFCVRLEQSEGYTSVRDKKMNGVNVAKALKLIAKLDLTDRIITE